MIQARTAICVTRGNARFVAGRVGSNAPNVSLEYADSAKVQGNWLMAGAIIAIPMGTVSRVMGMVALHALCAKAMESAIIARARE